MATEQLDQMDQDILDLLASNSRRTLADIAGRVRLAASAVQRRIDRLEARGVITGYTTVIDDTPTGHPIQALMEASFADKTGWPALLATVANVPEVQEVFAVHGEFGAIVRLRVPDIACLARSVTQIRSGGHLTSTRTLLVLSDWSRYPEPIARP